MAKNRLPWYMNPQSPIYKRYMKQQASPMAPYIKSMQAAMQGINPETDPYTMALQAQSQRDITQDPGAQMLANIQAALPTSEKISAEYGGAQQRLADYISKVDFGAGGKAVGDITSALGAAIGADLGQTKDVAQTAGTVSGMGGQGGDVYSKAILGGAGAQMEGLKAQRMSDVEGRRTEAMSARANLLSQLAGEGRQAGLEAAKQRGDLAFKKLEMGMNIGQAQSQNRQMFNPFGMATNQQALIQSILTNRNLMADLKKSGTKAGSWKNSLTGTTGSGNGWMAAADPTA